MGIGFLWKNTRASPSNWCTKERWRRPSFFSPDPLTDIEVLRAHDAEYWDKLCQGTLSRQEERRTGFPWSPALVDREVMIMGGTVQCARYALEHGVALNVAGGTHHAFRDRGEGFCLLNDIALAAEALLEEGSIQRALVMDLDVHQGNGTASMFANDERVFTFSMHGAGNYPMHKERSDLILHCQTVRMMQRI